MPDPVLDLHVRRSDGAFLALGFSGVIQISKDSGASWSSTCSLPGLRNLDRPETILSSQEIGSVLALTDKLYVIDQPVANAGPCPHLPLPPDIEFLDRALLAKKRILAKSHVSYFSSDDLGKTWTKLSINWKTGDGAPDPGSSGFALDAGNPERMAFAQCEPTGTGPTSGKRLVIRSRSSDAAPFTTVTSNMPCSDHDTDIAFVGGVPGAIHYSSSTPNLVSEDGGQSWFESVTLAWQVVGIPEGGFIGIDVSTQSTPSPSSTVAFKMASGGKGSTFTEKATFPVSSGTIATSVLQGGKGRYLLSWGGKLYASVDDGLTFKTISVPTTRNFFPAEVASRDGQTLWAVDNMWRVTRSTDGGTSWSLSYSGPSGVEDFPQWPRIFIHPYNDTSLVLHEEDVGSGSTYEEFRIATTSGFQQADAQSFDAFDSDSSAVGFLATDAQAHFIMNRDDVHKGTATAMVPVALPLSSPKASSWSPFPDLLSLPSASNTLFLGSNAGSLQARYEAYDILTGARRDLLSALGITPAGHAIAQTTNGPRLRVVSTTGQVRETADGLTFTDSTPTPFFQACSRRLLSVSGANTGRMATACLAEQDDLRLTTDNGKSWTRIPAEDLEGCRISQIAVTESKVLASCGEARKVIEVAL